MITNIDVKKQEMEYHKISSNNGHNPLLICVHSSEPPTQSGNEIFSLGYHSILQVIRDLPPISTYFKSFAIHYPSVLQTLSLY